MKSASSCAVAAFKSTLMIVALTISVWLVNKPLIDFNMMYPEQGILYLANQKIHSIWDLINVYLHPQMLHDAIPFFRPSGHFLIYQVLYPLVENHDLKALMLVNLFFLALTGFTLIKIYALLFPRYKMGGYIAFAIFLMHPALILSRFISLHFEFAYTFLVGVSLYWFISFFQKNQLNKTHLESSWMFILSLGGFVFATTFKESAVMLGPILMVFMFIFRHQGQKLNKQLTTVLLLLSVISITLAIYLTLPWPTLDNPARKALGLKTLCFTAMQFFYSVFDVGFHSYFAVYSDQGSEFWRRIAFPTITSVTMWVLTGSLISASLLLRKDFSDFASIYKRSMLFLIISTLFFLVLPLGWGMAYPWHFSLSILMLSLMMGFSCDYLCSKLLSDTKKTRVASSLIVIIIASQSILVNQLSVKKFTASPLSSLEFTLLRNAILNPPDIKQKLTATSVIVIEDNILKNGYVTGGGAESKDTDYNGTLFRWAYLMPELREKPYSFSINKMDKLNTKIIYQWLQQYQDIFCLSYDEKGRWYDHTTQFKQHLLKEGKTRKLF